MNKDTRKIRNTLLLLLTAIIWGLAFVAQSVSMDYIGPMTFIFLRCLLGAMVLFPFILITDSLNLRRSVSVDNNPCTDSTVLLKRWKDKTLIKGGIICGFFLFLGNTFQQNGIRYTTVGKAGFITAFYIIIIPVIGIFLNKKSGLFTWIAVAIALAGLYFLCINESLSFQTGDLLVFICAFMFSGQVLAIDHFSKMADTVKLSCLQFLTCGVIAFVFMLFTERPEISMIKAAAIPILYTGIMSTGVAYTLQTAGQKGLNPTVAALIMSTEAVFSAVAGFLILHQNLTVRELSGCFLMSIAIVLAQIPDKQSGIS